MLYIWAWKVLVKSLEIYLIWRFIPVTVCVIFIHLFIIMRNFFICSSNTFNFQWLQSELFFWYNSNYKYCKVILLIPSINRLIPIKTFYLRLGNLHDFEDMCDIIHKDMSSIDSYSIHILDLGIPVNYVHNAFILETKILWFHTFLSFLHIIK